MTKDCKPTHFIQDIIDEDNRSNTYGGRVHTRFPPEPNGYLHIGHAKSICLNFGLAKYNNGLCNLRFDDTDPSKEEIEYVDSIKEDVHWLGFDWGEREYYASDYFEQLYQYAIILIELGKAYVCDLCVEKIREYRGTLTMPGIESPYRERSVDENLDLFQRMRAGEFPDGARVLRAKIDMASPNLNLRDPVLYRIMRIPHHRTGDKWCIYPMYDYAHPLSDAIERITHSICTIEFEDHRPLYDWVIKNVNPKVHSKQIEFARLNLTNTLMSKRKLKKLVDEGYVSGWDDPRMPTISGLRRRGYTPEALRDFCGRIGVAKSDSIVDAALLEHCIREDLRPKAPRVMAVLEPVKLIIQNYPKDRVEYFEVEYNPEKPELGTRKLPFTRELYIEREDFREVPPPKYFRLFPDKEVRLKDAYIIKCVDFVKEPETGKVTEIHCTYDPDTKAGGPAGKRRVKGTLHWVSAEHSVEAEVRLYGYLFDERDPESEEGVHFINKVKENSIQILKNCRLEPCLERTKYGDRYQFLRHGYFYADKDYFNSRDLVFNRIVSLKSTWAKLNRKQRTK